MNYPRSESTNTTNGMGAAGNFVLTAAGVAGKTFTREISTIVVYSGTVTVVSGQQAVNDPERIADYPDWVNFVLEVGTHIVNFRTCELSGATAAVVYYGI